VPKVYATQVYTGLRYIKENTRTRLDQLKNSKSLEELIKKLNRRWKFLFDGDGDTDFWLYKSICMY